MFDLGSIPVQMLLVLLLQLMLGIWGAAAAQRSTLHPAVGFVIGLAGGIIGVIIIYVVAATMPKGRAPQGYHGQAPLSGPPPINPQGPPGQGVPPPPPLPNLPAFDASAPDWKCSCGKMNFGGSQRCEACSRLK